MNDQKEMKLLLDMYKGVSKDQRDKVQLMATEKKLRSEIEDLRNQLKKTQVNWVITDFQSDEITAIADSLCRIANVKNGRNWPTKMPCAKLSNSKSRNTNYRSKWPIRSRPMDRGLVIMVPDLSLVRM